MRILNLFSKISRKHQIPSPVQADMTQKNASWIVAFLVLLLALILIGMSSMNGVLKNWHDQLGNKMQLEIANPRPISLNQLIDLLHQTPGIQKIQFFQPKRNALEEQLQMLTPLPAIIEIDLLPKGSLDLNHLMGQASSLNIDMRVETYGQWQARIGQIVFFLETLSIVVMTLITLAVFVTISLVTRSGLVIHKEIIDTLQLMGATPHYIAKQFENQAFRLTLKGGVIGLFGILPFVYLMGLLVKIWHIPEIPMISPSSVVLVGVLLIPLVVSLLSRLIARLAVLKQLAILGA